MKNLVNFLDDYFDENIEETLCQRKFGGKISISKEKASEWQIKANRKTSREEEIEAFIPVEYWNIILKASDKKTKTVFDCKLVGKNNYGRIYCCFSFINIFK